MIYRELSLYNVDSIEDLKYYFFQGIELGIQGFIISPSLLDIVKDIAPEGIVLSCPIDYPYGQGHSKVRNHATIRAIRGGANAIDLPINKHLIEKGDISLLTNDILSNYEICRDRGVNLRIVLEYRHTDTKSMEHILNIIRDVGIEYVISRTELFVDNITDNILFCWDMALKYGLSPIVNGDISYENYGTIKNMDIFGVRLNNIAKVKSLGV